MIGIGFIDDLITDIGMPLVKKGVKALTGIDLESKELTAEDKQKIMDSQIEIMKIDFEKLRTDLDAVGEATATKIHVMHEDIFNSMHRI